MLPARMALTFQSCLLYTSYIPQVYDFVQEDGVVYTVMDYIEGESMDRILKRGAVPGQPQVIQWTVQLLEALCYLHSQPPHGILHGDIKPANIMLRPDGDICLIDYNIALALGEDGAVRAGFSRGYACLLYTSGLLYHRSGDASGYPSVHEPGQPGIHTGDERLLHLYGRRRRIRIRNGKGRGWEEVQCLGPKPHGAGKGH